jgi:hypothetical protein
MAVIIFYVVILSVAKDPCISSWRLFFSACKDRFAIGLTSFLGSNCIATPNKTAVG